MTPPAFRDRVSAIDAKGLRACAGLDPVTARMPAHLRERHRGDTLTLWNEFLGALVEATARTVAAYKPNWAFFLAEGTPGLAALSALCRLIRTRAPDALLVLDMKVGDIADTNHGYVSYAFEQLGADAVTLHPYLGGEALAPFFKDPSRGAFVLCRTSNPGASELQHLDVDGRPLYLRVARQVATWSEHANLGLVVGATAPEEIRMVRGMVPSLPLLIPGVGRQGGDLGAVVSALSAGGPGAAPYLINQSSSFMYASSERGYADDAARVLTAMQADITDLARA